MPSGLATRCTACGTVFRVVPDQLRVSEGWVRCGRCAEVFNAAEALLDLDTGAPRAAAREATRAMVKFGSARQTPGEGATHAGSALPPAPAPYTAPPTPAVPPAPAAPVLPPALADFGLRTPAAREAAASEGPMPTMDEAVSRFAADAAETETPAAPAAGGEAGAESPHTAGLPDITAEPRPAAAATPRFLRQAEQAARWRRPRVRAALAATVVLGAAALLAQGALAYRDLVAARFPATAPLLQAACQALGCSVGPAHVIEALVVESSGLVRVEKSSLYRLSVALRNRGALDVALPALELSLTDSQGQLVARRVLGTGELGASTTTLAAGRELQLQATLQAATAPVAGYTIELFYP